MTTKDETTKTTKTTRRVRAGGTVKAVELRAPFERVLVARRRREPRARRRATQPDQARARR